MKLALNFVIEIYHIRGYFFLLKRILELFFFLCTWQQIRFKQYLSRSSDLFLLSFNTILTFCTARWINLDFRSRAGTFFCLFRKVKFFPNDAARIWHPFQTQYRFMVDWLLFQQYFVQPPSSLPVNRNCFTVSRFFIVQSLFSCLFYPFWLVMECLKAHIEPIWILNDILMEILYRCYITVKWVSRWFVQFVIHTSYGIKIMKFEFKAY